jgi:hypothetical protein
MSEMDLEDLLGDEGDVPSPEVQEPEQEPVKEDELDLSVLDSIIDGDVTPPPPPVKTKTKTKPKKTGPKLNHQGEGGGRPTKFMVYMIEQVYNMTLLGLTHEEMAKVLDIPVETFYEWKKRHKKFAQALKEGAEVADAKVARAFYNRALGYTDPVSGNHIPPEPKCLALWLKNRQPNIWREKQEIHHSGSISIADQIKAAFDGGKDVQHPEETKEAS